MILQEHTRPLLSDEMSFYGLKLWAEPGSAYRVQRSAVRLWERGARLPVQVDAFLRQLSLTVLGVNVRLVLHHLHPVSSIALLTAVLADHVELANPVLGTQKSHIHYRYLSLTIHLQLSSRVQSAVTVFFRDLIWWRTLIKKEHQCNLNRSTPPGLLVNKPTDIFQTLCLKTCGSTLACT